MKIYIVEFTDFDDTEDAWHQDVIFSAEELAKRYIEQKENSECIFNINTWRFRQVEVFDFIPET